MIKWQLLNNCNITNRKLHTGTKSGLQNFKTHFKYHFTASKLPNASYRTAAVITRVLFCLLLVCDPTVVSAFWTTLVAPFGISHFSLQSGDTVQLEIWNWNFKELNRKKLQNWGCRTEEHHTPKLLPVSHRILFCALHQDDVFSLTVLMKKKKLQLQREEEIQILQLCYRLDHWEEKKCRGLHLSWHLLKYTFFTPYFCAI